MNQEQMMQRAMAMPACAPLRDWANTGPTQSLALYRYTAAVAFLAGHHADRLEALEDLMKAVKDKA